MEQQIAYCTTPDGVRIAYATYGNDEAPPLVYMPELPSQEPTWASPWGRAFLQALGAHRRLITFDGRGAGESRLEVDSRLLVATHIIAVADHLGLDTFDLFSGGPLSGAAAVIGANTYPGRVSKLVMFTPDVSLSPSIAASAASAEASLPIFLRSLATFVFPSGPSELQRWFYTAVRDETITEAFVENIARTYDLAPILPRLVVPALVLHRKRSQFRELAHVRSVAALLPGARLVMLDGDAAAPYWDHEQFIDILYDFLGIEVNTPVPTVSADTAVVLFTDIADSTALTERMGDTAFRAASRALDDRVRAALREFGGRPVEGKVLGDGVMGVFTSATQAIQAARRCVELSVDLPLHIGLHAGDVIREKDNVYGGAVNIASRICARCEPGEILVSATVRDLARTSAGATFEDRGEQMLKGIDDPVRVFAVRPESG